VDSGLSLQTMRELLQQMIQLYRQATTVKKKSKLLDALLFVEILCGVRTIIFRGISLCKMQNGHALTHIFSLQPRASFSQL